MMLGMLSFSFHCSGKRFGDALGLGIDTVPGPGSNTTESKSRMPGVSDVWRVRCPEAMNSGISLGSMSFF